MTHKQFNAVKRPILCFMQKIYEFSQYTVCPC